LVYFLSNCPAFGELFLSSSVWNSTAGINTSGKSPPYPAKLKAGELVYYIRYNIFVELLEYRQA
jgi:hypothetical protein